MKRKQVGRAHHLVFRSLATKGQLKLDQMKEIVQQDTPVINGPPLDCSQTDLAAQEESHQFLQASDSHDPTLPMKPPDLNSVLNNGGNLREANDHNDMWFETQEDAKEDSRSEDDPLDASDSGQ